MRVFLAVVLCFFGAVAAFAEPVERIEVEGNKRVEPETVKSYVSLEVGEEYTPGKASETVKSLYGSGLFSQVEILKDNGVITIQVSENPLVNKVAIEGNDKVVDDRIKSVLSLYPRAIYTPAKVQNDVREIKTLYRQTGRYLADVRPQLIERDQNRVDVIYKIDEGSKSNIEAITFVGNKRFTDQDLREVISTKESRWWRFLSSGDVYAPERMEFDKELLRRHYMSHGYADFNVISAVAELTKDKEKFFITFTLSEGPRYEFGETDVRLNTTEEKLTKDEMVERVDIRKGATFDASAIQNTMEDLIDYMGSKGFAFLDVVPNIDKDEVAKTVDVTFDINPGPRVYVNRINIEGNTRTRENVIRREMRFAEGDAFSTSKLRRSQERINYLGYFKEVDVTRSETSDPDRVDINVDVEEQSTGEFNLGAGFSTYEGALATADVRERNFLGKGQNVILSFSVSSIRQDYNFSFTEPYFMGKELSTGIDMFNRRTDFQSESSFDQSNVGGAFRLGVPLGEYTRNHTRLGFQEIKIDNVASSASQFVQQDEGKKASLYLSNTYSIDTRDSFLDPTKGHRIAVTTDYSGFGTAVEYVRGQLEASWHKPLNEDFTLSLAGRLGAIADLNGELPVYEHFSAGFGTLRGFERSGIGPRDRVTEDALGGRYIASNNIELSFPLPGVTEMGIKGLLFVDGGIITEFEDDPNVVDSKLYRVSAGTGIYWRSPLGPLRFEFGVPVLRSEEDRVRIFNFSVGTRF